MAEVFKGTIHSNENGRLRIQRDSDVVSAVLASGVSGRPTEGMTVFYINAHRPGEKPFYEIIGFGGGGKAGRPDLCT